MPRYATAEDEWRAYLDGSHPSAHFEHFVFRLLPKGPRCRLCSVPFAGVGPLLLGPFGFTPWTKNPHGVRRGGVERGNERLHGPGRCDQRAAHVAAQAGPSEILVTDAAAAASRIDLDGLERRTLSLKGHPVDAVVVPVPSATSTRPSPPSANR